MKIDVHWHYQPPSVAGRVPTAPIRHRPIPELSDPAMQAAELERRGLDMAAVSAAPGLFQYQLDKDEGLRLHRLVNDGVAELVRMYPARFVGLGTVPLQDPTAAVQELERAMQVLGLRGVIIGTNVNGRNLDAAELRPFFRAASELGAFVFVHPMQVLAPERLERYYLTNLFGNPSETALAIACLIFGGVYDECPNLTCCFAHGGGSFSALIGRWRHGYAVREEPKAFGARSPEEYLPRIYVDSLVHDDTVCQHIINVLGPDHMMLGCDMPYDMGAPDPAARIERLPGLNAEEKELILGRTAQRLLRLDVAATR